MAFSGSYRRYVPVAARRRQAEKQARRHARGGRELDQVSFDAPARGKRAIATTFWGKAWCDNLEHYADFSNRLPRGRTYVRNGSVIDLQIDRGTVRSLVMGSALYEISISIRPLAPARWKRVVSRSAGQLDSLVELLSGRMSDAVMRVVTDPQTGLFPAPREMQMRCSCPDWAGLCKHLAATLYGVGARLDQRPELLFLLRAVDPDDLVEHAATGTARITSIATGASSRPLLANDSIADVFGIELDAPSPTAQKPTAQKPTAPKPTGPKPTAPKPTARKPKLRKHKPPIDARVTSFIRENPGQRIEQIATALGVTTRELVLPVKRLLTDGGIVTRGMKRATRYYVAGRTNAKKPERETLATALDAAVRRHPGRKMEDIARELGLSARELAAAMRSLIMIGRVRARGVKRATRYFPRV